MAKEKIIYTIARLTGLALLGATILHATFGTAEVMTAIKLGDIRASMANTVRSVWIYSAMMLLLSSIWTFFVAGELRQLKRRGWWQGLFIGLGYTLGPAGCMAIAGVQAHLVGFMLIGLFLLVPLIVWAGHFRAP